MSVLDALCKAGRVTRIARVGHPPLGEDDPIEIGFDSGATFHLDVGFEDASDIVIGPGPLLERVYGHLRTEEPDTFAAIARDWSREDMSLPWLLGANLRNPRRLTMTKPYRLDVGYAFEAGGRTLALFGESDCIFAADIADPDIETFGLEIGAAA